MRFKSYLTEKSKEERHVVRVKSKFITREVHFIREPHPNPKLNKEIFSTIGYDLDHRGNRESTPNHMGRYNKEYDTEKQWKAALNRMKNKEAKDFPK